MNGPFQRKATIDKVCKSIQTGRLALRGRVTLVLIEHNFSQPKLAEMRKPFSLEKIKNLEMKERFFGVCQPGAFVSKNIHPGVEKDFTFYLHKNKGLPSSGAFKNITTSFD